MKKQTENLLDNKIVNSFAHEGVMHTLEKRADNLYVVKSPGSPTSIHTTIAPAEAKFNSLKLKLKGGETNMNGEEQARALADKLRAETAEKAEVQENAMVQAKNQLEMVRQNSSLSELFKAEAKKEMGDSLGSQPLLKIHVTGRSNNELIDGTQPEDGSFFHTATQEAFKDPSIHLLVMSDGFYAEGLPDDRGEAKIAYNNLIGGTIIDSESDTVRPFIMYITSQAIRQSFWEFRNEINKYARLMRVPKMALVVKLTHEKITNPNPTWVKTNPKVNNIKFTIQKFPDGTPALVTDQNEAEALIDIQAMLKDMIDSIIARKRVDKPLSNEEIQEKTPAPTQEVVEAEEVPEAEGIDPDAIPF